MNGLNQIKYLYDAEKPEIVDFKVFRAPSKNHKNRRFFIFRDASGTKLACQTVEEGTPDEEITTNYCGSFVYEEGELQYLLTQEGRIVFTPDGLHDYPLARICNPCE